MAHRSKGSYTAERLCAGWYMTLAADLGHLFQLEYLNDCNVKRRVESGIVCLPVCVYASHNFRRQEFLTAGTFGVNVCNCRLDM